MKKQSGITARIVILLCITVCFLGVAITVVGSRMIYQYTENGVQSEIQMAARTLKKLYDSEFVIKSTDGEIINKKTNEVMSFDDFDRLTSYIGCPGDIDFTLFRNDTRIFTSVKNADGSIAVGTKADDDVTENALLKNKEYFNRKVVVNGQLYAGCYIPIIANDGSTVGMCFAGKPLYDATANAIHAVTVFIIISVSVLIVSLCASVIYLQSIISGMTDIKQFIAGVSKGDFTVRMDNKTLNRTDEIGDIGQHALKLRDNLRDMVERDPLTTLFNRRSCRKKISDLEKNSMPYAIIMADVDFFKKINDDYGHAAGDEILKSVSDILSEYAKNNNGWFSRWGGEEFLGVFPQKNIDQVREMFVNLIEIIRNAEFRYNDETIKITMTFGAAVNNDGEKMDVTIKRADDLLYKGKQNGRNRFEI